MRKEEKRDIMEINEKPEINEKEQAKEINEIEVEIAEEAKRTENREKRTESNSQEKGTAHKKIQIKGMVCESCEKIIEKSVGKLDGVKHVHVNYVNSTAKIEYAPNKTTL